MELINEWTRTLRYRPYQNWPSDYYQQLKNTVQQSSWRLNYHIQPPTGLLNDPNGFSYFNGKWHLFYQHYPFGPVHGLKSWFHLTSENLVDWKEEGIALWPDTKYDSHGVYSGTALAINDQLFLAYTGNVRDNNWERHPYQLGAWMDKNNTIKKIDKPLISSIPEGFTDHFRDPQLLTFNDTYFIIIGGQTKTEKGKVLVYQSEDLVDWQLKGSLTFGQDDLGYMVECPNLVFIDQQPVLLFCPQGLRQDTLSYQNIYPNTYIIGSDFDLKNLDLKDVKSLKNLDEGFDVYATQAFNAPDGRVLAISWVGLPEIDYPSDEEGWAHCLSLVKELSLKNNKLYQKPASEYQTLRNHLQEKKGSLTQATKLFSPSKNCYELDLTIDATSKGSLQLFSDIKQNYSLTLHFDTINGKLILDRGKLHLPFAQDYGTTRKLDLEKNKSLHLQIFVDASICEIFINDGAQTMTSRVFPKAETDLFLSGTSGKFQAKFWPLRSAQIS